ncbi:efflux RND transporter periplasmic adaptor subunit, partial [Sneathiella sp.]|uniref:efflux RND transporter periplasmic adaptor subunit n=1 Tax=Sneathiella sp. TaxID=1964365 RepID=UPI0039E23EFB
MKIINQIIILVLLLAVGFGAWHYKDELPFIGASEQAGEKSPRRKARAVSVIAEPVQVRDLQRTISAVGSLKALEAVDITSKVTAKILSLQFEEGSFVEKGTVLFTLDATEPKAELAESQAELINSRKLYERTLKLFKSGNSPKARVDLLLSELQIAEAKVAANKARLNDYEVKAPFSGKLGFRQVSAGSLVRPGDVITTLDDVSSLKLDFNLPESYLAHIREGQDFQAISVAYADRLFDGKVQIISTRVDPVTRAVQVRGLLLNKDGLLKPGMFLSVRLQTGLQKNAVMVPEQSIVVSAAGHFVFVIKE